MIPNSGCKIASHRTDLPAAEREKERTILTGLVIGVATLVPFIYITIVSGSVMLQAEAFRSGNETFAIFLSWLALKLIQRNPGRFLRLEQQMASVVGIVMMLSAAIIIFNTLQRFESPKIINITGGLLGIAATIFSASVNGWLWHKNLRVANQTASLIMAAQWQLFRSKFLINLSVLTTLILSLAFRNHAFVKRLDPVISLLLALFIILSAYKLFTKRVNYGKD